ncbi:hypothetical protein TTHERM_00492409 (macronuclear) [Tetrahymena thermophila SB210]|uniref:PWWP domain protein n=1 Tax=Tetrahymena thermophila (strain SB210) TaxID=312017 RepID=A4VD29_TETTS|nr:hypothetical protein TTHERM_00492409 [Tetrahymena thermophila SB210]EDK31430.2 hypothetical protein TTHERM_00492409 [Tetrahymena thermophila SB210]|eukprot:XP_001470980.2 hypothetical protein TTHERM_00492409 [Tetrahymena thermophila SB210]
MILSKDQIVFCRIKAKCYWPAQIKQTKRGGGFDVQFINKDDQEIQNKNESDIILFDEGLDKFKGSKQQGFEDALEKARQIIEEQSNQKKAQKKLQNSTTQNIQAKQGLSSTSNNNNKGISSNLTKRRHNQISSNNSIESLQSLEESSQGQEAQPSKKLQVSNTDKGKVLTKKSTQPAQSIQNENGKEKSTNQKNLYMSTKERNNKATVSQVQSSKVSSKKSVKIDEKQEKKQQQIEQINKQEGKRTPTRSQSKNMNKNDSSQVNQSLLQETSKPSTPLKGNKNLQESSKENLKNQQKVTPKKVNLVASQINDNKKITRKQEKQSLKSDENEKRSLKTSKGNKNSNNGNDEQEKDSKQKKREISESSQVNLEGKKKIQKKSNQKIAPTSSSTSSSLKTRVQQKKNDKKDSENTKHNKSGLNNLENTVKQEEASPSKKGTSKSKGQRKSASKKKEKNGNNEHLDDAKSSLNMFFHNEKNKGFYGEEFTNYDHTENFVNNNNNTNISQHFQESPEFGQKNFGESNNNILNLNEELSKGIFQNISNNTLLTNLLAPSSSQSIYSNAFQGMSTNNLFLANENNSDNNTQIFSLNNSPFGNKDKKYFDDQDELNLAIHPDENKSILSLNQQQQILLNALKSGGVTQQQFDFYSQKLQNNNQNAIQLFDGNNQGKQLNTNQNNIKFNNIFASNQTAVSENQNGIDVLGNITNQIKNLQNQQTNNKNSIFGSQQSVGNSLINQTKNELNGLPTSLQNNMGMSSSIANQSSILSFGVPSCQDQMLPQGSINSQIYTLKSQGDFLSQSDVLSFSQGNQLQNSSSLFASGIQTSVQAPPSFGNQNSQQQNNHSVIIPSPLFVTKQNSGQSNLQISNNSSFKLSPQSNKQQKCEVYNQMKNKILPMLEMKIKNKVYYENEKDMWLCEIVDCVHKLKAIPIEQIYQGEYSMILEQIYDALLTIQETTKRNFQYVLGMIQRTMTTLDKKIIKYLHDYSRVRGEKYNITREEEIQKKFSQGAEQAIKIEDNNESFEISSQSSAQYQSRYNKSQNGYQNQQIKIDPSLKQTAMSPPSKQNYADKENESTAKKDHNKNKNEFFYNNNHNNSTNTTINSLTSTSMNQSMNNDIFNLSISETLREINNQNEFQTRNNQILESEIQSEQSLQKAVKEEVIA